MISAAFLSSYCHITVVLFSLLLWCKYNQGSTAYIVRKDEVDYQWSWLYAISIILLMGFRDVYDARFGDTVNYRTMYHIYGRRLSNVELIMDTDSEWLWRFLGRSFATSGISVEIFFLVIAAGYIGFMMWGVSRLMPYNQWIGFLFCVSSFSFITYGVNGLRNGLACSMIILAVSLALDRKKISYIIAAILAFLAMGIHRSVALPILCGVIALTLIKSTKNAIGWWLFSIALSLVAGEAIQKFFATLGFDDRMNSYAGVSAENSRYAHSFTHTGFRFDFLIYSAMPILLGYYIIYKKKIRNLKYEILLNTYILANSFWIMVIRASFSNRFAYLSWFLYPIVLAYPLLKVYFKKNQDQWTVNILLASVAFTLFMSYLY